MIDDEDELTSYDLDAWQAPPAPAGLADAVIRRMKAPPRAGPIEVGPPARGRRWWIAAAALVAAAALLLVIVIGAQRAGSTGERPAPVPSVDPPVPPCDADAAADAATAAMSNGDYAGALAGFERSLACNHDPALIPSAFVAACGVKNLERARVYWRQLPASKQPLLQRCLSYEIDPR